MVTVFSSGFYFYPKNRVAAVMTMHDLITALRYADNYIFLRDGKIFDAGTVYSV